MLTEFGIEVRQLRMRRGMRLLDLAAALGKSSAYISAIETGKKPIPDGIVDEIANAMGLDSDDKFRIQRAADRSKREVRIDQLDGNEKELVAAFARKVGVLPDDLLEQVKKRVFKSNKNHAPFRRNHAGYLVDPRSQRELWDFADSIWDFFCEPGQIYFPIMDVLEFRLNLLFDDYYLDICDLDEMRDEEGRVSASGNSIQLRVDVYERAWKRSGRDRFTACHELGHFLLHREAGFSRRKSTISDPVYRDSEWQADTFAGGLLMPRRLLWMFSNSGEAAEACVMTYTAADVMWRKYESGSRKKER